MGTRPEGYGTAWHAEPGLVASLLLESSPEAVVLVAADHTVQGWSRGAERALGWRAADVLGRPDPSVDPAERERTAPVLESLLRGGSVAHGRTARRVRPDGSVVTVVLTAAVPVDLPSGRHLAVFFRPASHDEALHDRRTGFSRALVEAVREEDVLRVTADAVRDVLGATGGAVLSRCAGGAHLHGSRSLGGYQEEAERLELDLADHDAPWSLAARGTVGFAVSGPDLLGAGAPTMFVPMGPAGGGWVLAVWFGDGVPDEPALVPVVRVVADEAWLALQRAELVGDLEGKLEILQATAAVAATAGLDLDATVRAVALQAASALSCERAAVYLRDADGDLTLAAMHATDLRLDDEVGLRMALEVLSRGDAVVVQDAAGCEFADGPWHRERGAVSVFGLPLRVGTRDVGVLVVAHTVLHPRGFTSLCTQVGAAVAQQSALAIEHARLYVTQQQAVADLTELDRVKREYIAGITHDLRTPLTGLLGFVKTLRRFGDGVSREDQRRFLSAMERQAQQLVEMVEDMLLTAQIDAGEAPTPTLSRLDLTDVVRDALSLYAPDDAARFQLAVPQEDVVVLGDAGQLRRVVHNLVDNALRHGTVGGRVQVVVARYPDGTAVVDVCDDGPGVRPGDEDRIFERFAQATGLERAVGGAVGLGLHIGRTVARAHDGDLVYVPLPEGGACFQLRLPVVDGAATVPAGDQGRQG